LRLQPRSPRVTPTRLPSALRALVQVAETLGDLPRRARSLWPRALSKTLDRVRRARAPALKKRFVIGETGLNVSETPRLERTENRWLGLQRGARSRLSGRRGGRASSQRLRFLAGRKRCPPVPRRCGSRPPIRNKWPYRKAFWLSYLKGRSCDGWLGSAFWPGGGGSGRATWPRPPRRQAGSMPT